MHSFISHSHINLTTHHATHIQTLTAHNHFIFIYHYTYFILITIIKSKSTSIISLTTFQTFLPNHIIHPQLLLKILNILPSTPFFHQNHQNTYNNFPPLKTTLN